LFTPVQNKTMMVGNGDMLRVAGKGTVGLKVKVTNGWEEVTLDAVLHIPDLVCNLFSTHCATYAGAHVEMSGKHCRVS
jgi:hypothetical protein